MAKNYAFGTGDIFATDAAGNSVKIGTLQNVSVGFSFDEKTLHGSKGFAVAVARGKGKIEGKWESGEINVQLFNSLFFGETSLSTEGRRVARNEAGTIPGTPFSITAANGTVFNKDMGVINATTGDPFIRIPSAGTPTSQQYKVSAAGVYTFAAADVGIKVLLNYMYNTVSGGRLEITNKDMGAQPVFELILASKFKGTEMVLNLYSCTSNKFDMPFKQDDFLIGETAFSAFANDADQIGFISLHQ